MVGAGLAILFVAEPFGTHHGVLRGLAWHTSVRESRTILSSVLGIVLTTLSIALSLSVLVLQNTAGQYSPRLLRLFMGDLGSRILVPVFVATSVYCLVGVYAFGFVEDTGVAPRPALTLAMLLLVCCGAALVFQMTYTLKMVRAEQIVRRVRASSLEVAHELDRLRRGDSTAPAPEAGPSGTWRSISAPASGFVLDIEAGALLALAVAHGVSIHVSAAIGEPVVQGDSLGRVVSEGASPEEVERVARTVETTLLIGPWREPGRDLALGVQQLVDVATKALSPGINDPATAVESVDQLTILLCELSRLRQGPRVLADARGRPRVFLRALELRDYLVLATEQISRYGARETVVVLRLFRLAGELGLRVSEEPDRRAVREVLHQVWADTEEAQPGSSHLPLLRRYAEEVERAVERKEPLPPLPAPGF
ncbi:DUF2254 domain-containing protein [Myxococcus sp. RHSTA-1-4]|uniref:DUF2254 domain-containing protein n=1 Tax=Myxococcus sp. RHSTA-1-4 TaxID=2874601 RepID=UPI00351D3187|nr:DUF2254 domain-containing protein [Myxococcus sp. RHSTA-1-4]